MFRSIIKSLVTVIIKCTPKFKYCFLKGVPTYEDSLVSIYMKLELSDIQKVIWSCQKLNDEAPFKDRGKTIYVKKGSLKELYYGIVSKYIFTSHGHFIPVIPDNQKCFNVWHGMPIKGIGLLDDQKTRQDTYLTATSVLYQEIMSKSFGMPLEKTLILGIPRNDLLRELETEEVWERAGLDRNKFKKIFLWLPTYRKSVLGYLTEDGVEVNNVFNMEGLSLSNFQLFLEENECLCIVKPHPMAPRKNMAESANILLIDEHWLWKRKLTLYHLLGEVDCLISDISSVMIDFMLLNRPIIVCFQDIEEYRDSRNLNFEPIEDWLPSDITTNYTELELRLNECIADDDVYFEKRNHLTAKFHDEIHFEATERVIKTMDLGINKIEE